MTLLDFAKAMENELIANSDKGGWQDCSLQYLINRLKQELGELERAIAKNESKHRIVSEAADVANFSMMIADNYEEQ